MSKFLKIKTEMGWLRVVATLVVTLVALYSALVVAAYSLKSKLTFIPLKQLLLTEEKQPEDVFVSNSLGRKLHGWFFRAGEAENSGCALVCHGNGANLSYYPVLVSLFAKLGMSVCIFDYPGYGLSEGHPSEANLYESGVLFFDQLVQNFGFQPGDIAVAGMSLGGAVATEIVRQRPGCRALVLIATFVSPRQLLRTLFWPLMAVGFVANEFFLNENLELVTAMQPELKTVVMHSRTDGLIDFSHAVTNAKTARARLLEIDGWHGDPRFSAETVRELGVLIGKKVSSPPPGFEPGT